jgi:SAM-dependent methyltransferase
MSDISFWDARYAEEGFAYGEEPNAFLVNITHRIKPGGSVLVPGDGEGRNGVYLARMGFNVTSVDMSATGCEKAEVLRARHDVSMNIICADLTLWEWPVAKFDAVVSIFLHFPDAIRAALHAKMREALVPNGIIIVEAFDPAHLPLRTANPKAGGPAELEMLYTKAMLKNDFAPLKAVQIEQLESILSEGQYHQGRSSVIRAIFGI